MAENILSIEEQVESFKDLPYKDKIQETVTVPCKECGAPIKMKFKSYKRLEKMGEATRCRKCLAKEAKERYANLSDEEKARRAQRAKEHATAQWASMDEEARKKQTANAVAAMREYRENITPEQKAELARKMSVSHKEFYANLSDEEKARRIKAMRDGADKYYAEMDPEEKKRRIQRMEDGKKKWWENASEEEKERIRELRSKASREYWDKVHDGGLSELQKKEIKKWWRVMNPKDFYQYTKGRVKPEHISELLLNPIEKEFESYLKKSGVEYDVKRPNTTDENGFHVWGFAIHKGDDNTSVFIDVDGALHNPSMALERVKDADSKRADQHDGKVAYIIEAYDDIITTGTPVQKIDGGKITVGELMKVLS